MFRARRIQPVINGTGILIHTNFGRVPLGPAVIEKLKDRIAATTILNMTLPGEREAAAPLIWSRPLAFCAAEAATVVNNNAAALVLILRHFCGGPRGRLRAQCPQKAHAECAAQK